MKPPVLGLVVVFLAAACGGSPSAAPPSVAPTSAATSPASPTPTTDLEHPVGVIAIGHSGLTGEGVDTSFPGQTNEAASWATGTLPKINSVYRRLLAVRPETKGHVANTARGGGGAELLASQARSALAEVPAPALAIIQTVDNDILCDGSNIADVGTALAAALTVIHDASPNTKILVVGQAGRPSVTFIKALVAFDPSAKAGLTWDDDCSFFDTDGNLRVSGVQKLSKVVDAYEAETARVCAAVPNCATDGGVRKAWIDKIKYYSPDYAHLNAQGQTAEAKQMWPVVEQLLGL